MRSTVDLWTYDGEYFHLAAAHGEPGFAEWLRRQGPLSPARGDRGIEGLLKGGDYVHYDDALQADDFQIAPGFLEQLEIAGIRTVLTVPLRKEGILLGLITIFRREVAPFSDKQIALLQNFAAQAVIAMENARLLTETREALEQQTATAEVLQVINSSPGDLAPVFDAILEKAHSLCEAAYGVLWTYDGVAFRPSALHNVPQPYADVISQGPFSSPPGRGNGLGQIAAGADFAHFADVAADEAFQDTSGSRAVVEIGGARTMLVVALRKDATLLGAITAYRKEVRPFSDKQVALLQNFAAQAVIAMENARLLTETREALEQQTATAEILRVIAGSTANVQPAFDAIAAAAVRLTGASLSGVATYDGKLMHLAAMSGVTPEDDENIRAVFPIPADDGTATGRAILTRQVTHIKDMAADPEHAYPVLAQSGGQTVLAVPMLRDGTAVGAINVQRRQAEPFTEKQIDLFKSFADQAVIAMENARLITETREALEQQTATAEVLQVINSSPGDLAPVFDAMLEKAMRLCGAAFGSFLTFDGEHFRAVVHRGVPAELVESLRQPQSPTPGGSFERLVRGEPIVHLADISDDDAYRPGLRGRVAMVDIGGARTAVWVALRKDDALLGALVLYRQEVLPFTDKQIVLLQSFAAQAVIAMENARLMTETREALEQQTATAEVLQVINSSPGDLTPVFDAILEKAHTLCGAALGGLVLFDGVEFRPVAVRADPVFAEHWRRTPVQASGDAPLARLLNGAPLAHVADVQSEDAYRDIRAYRDLMDRGAIRTLLIVPLRKDSALLGVIAAYRQEVRPFTDKQIALLQNFAAQAVIAMENARLITETA